MLNNLCSLIATSLGIHPLNSHSQQVIPYGPYLPDDFDYTELEYVRLFSQASRDSVVITIKVLSVCLLLPLLVLVAMIRKCR